MVLGAMASCLLPACGCRGGREVVVEQGGCFGFVAGEQVAVAVEGDRNAGVAEVAAERLGVDSGGDHQRREGVAALVQVDRLETGAFPFAARAADERGGVEGSTAGGREHEPGGWPSGT